MRTSWWRFWNTEPTLPTITLKVLPNETVSIETTWPATSGDDASLHMSKLLATTIFLLTNGEMVNVLRHSLIKAGEIKGQEKVSAAAVQLLDQAFQIVRDNVASSPPRSGVYVPRPNEVFMMTGDEHD